MAAVKALVRNPTLVSLRDGSEVRPAQSRRGPLLVSNAGHGAYYTENQRGNLFMVGTPITGANTKIFAAPYIGTMAIWNPAGSGVYLEFIEHHCSTIAASLVNGVALLLIPNVSRGYITAISVSNTKPIGLNIGLSGGKSNTLMTTAYTINAYVLSATVQAGGTGMSVGTVLTATGGTASVAATFTVTGVSGGTATTVSPLNRGIYSVLPSNAVSTTGGGNDATLNITWSDPLAPLMGGANWGGTDIGAREMNNKTAGKIIVPPDCLLAPVSTKNNRTYVHSFIWAEYPV